MFLLTLPNNFC